MEIRQVRHALNGCEVAFICIVVKTADNTILSALLSLLADGSYCCVCGCVCDFGGGCC